MNEDLLNIDIIKEYIAKRKIDWTKHCLNRLNQRNIQISTEKWEEDMKTRREK